VTYRTPPRGCLNYKEGCSLLRGNVVAQKVAAPDAALNPHAVAAYVYDMTLALAPFARAHGLSTLACFLDMAAIEAQDRAGTQGGVSRSR
jgi:hypothetical protein